MCKKTIKATEYYTSQQDATSQYSGIRIPTERKVSYTSECVRKLREYEKNHVVTYM